MKLNEPGYQEVVVVNTGDGVLTKVGSIGGGSGVIVDGEIFITFCCISVENYFYWYKESVALFQLGLPPVAGSAMVE